MKTQRKLNSTELRNYKISVDEIEIIKDQFGVPVKVECWCYLKGCSDVLNGEYESKFIPYDKYELYAQTVCNYKNMDEYMQEASIEEKYADAAILINRIEDRTEEYPEDDPSFPELDKSLKAVLHH